MLSASSGVGRFAVGRLGSGFGIRVPPDKLDRCKDPVERRSVYWQRLLACAPGTESPRISLYAWLHVYEKLSMLFDHHVSFSLKCPHFLEQYLYRGKQLAGT